MLLFVTVILIDFAGCANNANKKENTFSSDTSNKNHTIRELSNTDPKFIVQEYLPNKICLISGFNLTHLYPLFGNVKSVYAKDTTFGTYYLYTFDKRLNITEISEHSKIFGTNKCVFTYDRNNALAEIEEYRKGVLESRHKLLYENGGLRVLLLPYLESGMLHNTPDKIFEYESNPKRLITTFTKLNSQVVNEFNPNYLIINEASFESNSPSKGINLYERDQYGRFTKHYYDYKEGKGKILVEWCDNEELDVNGNVQMQICYDGYEKFGKEYKGNSSSTYIKYKYW